MRYATSTVFAGALLGVGVALTGCTLSGASRPPQGTSQASPAVTQWRHEWAQGAVFYQIFVRSFHDSNGDGIGDLPGLIAKLDYLNDGDPGTDSDLAVDGIWLMPVFQSPSYHGYDVVDYETVEADYGTNDDLLRLLDEAHRRGIRVIVDFVMNHSGVDHPWFQASASGPGSPYRDWYVWRDRDPGWQRPWGQPGAATWHANPNGNDFYYGIFWGGMPDLNFRTAAVRNEMQRLAAMWLRRGLDGYRLDATRHLFANGDGEAQNDQPETHAYLKEFATYLRGVKPEAMLVGENWTSTANIGTYFGNVDRVRGGDELPGNFNFPLADAIVTAVRTGSANSIYQTLNDMSTHYPKGVLDAPFLRNHDQIRLATELENQPGRIRTAISILLTLPGMPFLYYGEEVGLQNGGPDRRDELKRTPMPWSDEPGGGFTTGNPWHPFAPGRAQANVAAQSNDAGSLLNHYRRLIRLRKRSTALSRGNIVPLPLDMAPGLAYLRRSPEQAVLVVHNLAARTASLGPFAVDLDGAAPLGPVGVQPEEREGAWWIELPGYGSAVLAVSQ